MSRHAKIRRYNGRTARFYLAAHAISGWSRNSTKCSLPPASVSGEETAACIAPSRARYAPRPATYINNGREYSESEDTLLLPSESEALSDVMVVRRPEGVSGSVAMAIRWDRCHGGAAWNIHPPASFPRFPPLPPFLPRPSLPSLSPSLSFPLSLSLSLSLHFSLLRRCHRSHRLRFSPPVYIRIHSAALSAIPDHPPHHPRRPFRLFCSQADSLSTEATVAGFGLLFFSLLLRHLIAHRPPRDFISSRRV